MSGKVEASIKDIVNDLQDVRWEQIVFEAVTNSLQANATNINTITAKKNGLCSNQ